MSKVCTFALLNRICEFIQKVVVEAKICKQHTVVVVTVIHKLK